LVIEVPDDRGRFRGSERARQLDGGLQRKVYVAVASARPRGCGSSYEEVLYQLRYATAGRGVISPREASLSSTAAPYLHRVAGEASVCGLPIGLRWTVRLPDVRCAGRPSMRAATAVWRLHRTRQKLARNSARIAHELPSHELEV
jgi:hypothetical protein